MSWINYCDQGKGLVWLWLSIYFLFSLIVMVRDVGLFKMVIFIWNIYLMREKKVSCFFKKEFSKVQLFWRELEEQKVNSFMFIIFFKKVK